MRMRLRYNNSKGVTVVEIVVVATIISVALVALLGFVSFSLRQSQVESQTASAISFAKEELEATRNFRDGMAWSSGRQGR